MPPPIGHRRSAAGWGASLTGGHDRQGRQDLNGDGWADMPGYRRWTIRPRLFWTGSDGASVLVTAGAMRERRAGGALSGDVAPDGRPFAQALDSRRFDGGLVADAPLASGTLHLRASATTLKEDRRFGEVAGADRRRTMFGEASFRARAGATAWLAGAAFQADVFRAAGRAGLDYSYTVPALFAQVEQDVVDRLTLAGSARWDLHSRYGSRISPRLSLLYRTGRWTVRASLGRGFSAPTLFVEEVEEAGLSRLRPLVGLRAETADTASLDIGYRRGPVEASLTLFGLDVRHAVRLEDDGAEQVRLVNVAGLTRTRGAELLLRYRWHAFSITGSYVRVDATEPDPSGAGRRTMALTPRHTGGLVGMWEKEGRARDLGVSLDQVRALLAPSDRGGEDCAEIDRIAKERLRDVEQKVADLLALQRELKAVIESCRGGTVEQCRIIEAPGPRSCGCSP